MSVGHSEAELLAPPPAAEVARQNAERVFQGLDKAQLEQLSQSLGVIYDNVAKQAPWARRCADPEEER